MQKGVATHMFHTFYFSIFQLSTNITIAFPDFIF